MNIAQGGMPLSGLGAASPVASANGEQRSLPRKHGTVATIQVYGVKNPAYRQVLAGKLADTPMAIIEMSMHSPASSEQYKETRIWVAVPSDVRENIDMQQRKVNSLTALPMIRNLLAENSPFNSAIITGYPAFGLVPSMSWDQTTDMGKSEDQLLKEGKLTHSHVLVATGNGVVPTLTFDHSKKLNHPELDYEQVRVKYGREDLGMILREHPTVNTIQGYAAMDPKAQVPEFYASANTRLGYIDTTPDNKPLDRHRLSLIGSVFQNGVDNNGAHIILEVQDNRAGEASRAAAFSSELVDGVINEVEFNGSLRVASVRNSTACLFRVQVNSWYKHGAEQAAVHESKGVDLGFLSDTIESTAMPTGEMEDKSSDPIGDAVSAVEEHSGDGESLEDLTSQVDPLADSDELEDLEEAKG
jgi:hypothetical protein